MVGRVASVDPQANKVALKAGWFGRPKQFSIGFNTVITEGNRRLRLSDLTVGDRVAIRYAKGPGGEPMARSIAIRSKKQAAETRG